jgi:hypothetical protein
LAAIFEKAAHGVREITEVSADRSAVEVIAVPGDVFVPTADGVRGDGAALGWSDEGGGARGDAFDLWGAFFIGRELQYRNHLFELPDARLVPFVKRPLPDPLAVDQASLRQNLQVLTGGGLANGQLFRDEQTTHAILHKIAVDLRPEVRPRIVHPFENLQASVIGDGPKRQF